MGPSRPNPAGGWGLRTISLSFVVNDASASPPPLFAISPRKTHPQTSSYLWKGVLSEIRKPDQYLDSGRRLGGRGLRRLSDHLEGASHSLCRSRGGRPRRRLRQGRQRSPGVVRNRAVRSGKPATAKPVASAAEWIPAESTDRDRFPGESTCDSPSATNSAAKLVPGRE